MIVRIGSKDHLVIVKLSASLQFLAEKFEMLKTLPPNYKDKRIKRN